MRCKKKKVSRVIFNSEFQKEKWIVRILSTGTSAMEYYQGLFE